MIIYTGLLLTSRLLLYTHALIKQCKINCAGTRFYRYLILLYVCMQRCFQSKYSNINFHQIPLRVCTLVLFIARHYVHSYGVPFVSKLKMMLVFTIHAGIYTSCWYLRFIPVFTIHVSIYGSCWYLHFMLVFTVPA